MEVPRTAGAEDAGNAATELRRTLSQLVGWLSDRRIPRFLRAPLFRAYARLYDVDLSQLRVALEQHASLGAFFVRRLKSGARPFPSDPDALPAPADGRLQALDRIEGGSLLQAKGRAYGLDELLAGEGTQSEFEGGTAWTIYLSPRDYHRVHCPADARLVRVRWVAGERRPVRSGTLARRDRVLSTNERAVLRLETANGPLMLVMVGALNVGRIRVVGVEPGSDAPRGGRAFARGDELARFELGSTVVLIAPPGGPVPAGPGVGQAVRMGEVIGRTVTEDAP